MTGRRIDRGPQRRAIGDIENLAAHIAAALGEPAHRGIKRGCILVKQGDPRAVVGHSLSVGETDAACRASHDGRQAAHVE